MVSEAHCMPFPCTELLLFNYAKVKTVFHSMAPLILWWMEIWVEQGAVNTIILTHCFP